MEKQQEVIYQDEVSLKDIILTIWDYFKSILWGSWLILLMAIPISYIAYDKWSQEEALYSGDLTLMLNDDTNGGGGALNALLGIPTMASGDINKVAYISTTRTIIEEVLFSPAIIKEKNDLLINHFIEEYELKRKWSEEDRPDTSKLNHKGFTNTPISNSSKLDKRIFAEISGLIKKTYFTTDLDKDTGILTLSCQSPSEEFVIAFLKTMFDKISDFYVDKTIQKETDGYVILKRRADSLSTVLRSKELQLAREEDSNRGQIFQETQIDKQQLARDVGILKNLSSGAIAQLEQARLTLQDKKPYVQLIDEPVGPLSYTPVSKMKYIILVILGSIFSASFIIIVFKTIRDALRT